MMMNIKLLSRLFTGLWLFLSLGLSPAANLAQASAPSANPDSPLVAGDELWANNFMLGSNADVDAVAIHGNDFYIGGDFTSVGGIPASHIAHYNTATHQWSALGGGVNNRVYAIISNGRYVYVGGYFTHAGNVNATDLAVWDNQTQTWSKVGNADLVHAVTSPSVKALAFDNQGHLIVGGQFDTIGGLSTPNIAKWNGSTWSKLGAGVGDTNAEVDALAVSGNDLYAGGTFTTPSYSVAHWNGSSWSGLGSGLIHSFYKDVYAVAVSGSNVYIGGSFDTVTDSGGDLSVKNIARWNGSHWSSLGTGIDASVYTLGVDGSGNLYAGGQYNTAGGTTVNKIAVWNGSSWAALRNPESFNAGTSSNVYSLVVSGNDVFVGGAMTTAGDFEVNHVARWNIVAQNWFSLGGGTDQTVNAVAVKGADVYVGGQFQSTGGVVTHAIARWNVMSQTWSSLGSGLAGCEAFLCYLPSVNSILIVGDDVYVGGNFNSAGGIAVHGIARWNIIDKHWHALGSGMGCSTPLCAPQVLTMVFDGSCVIVGGSFSSAGGVTASNLAQWCGSSWSNVVWNDGTDHIVQTNKSVDALAYDSSLGVLYVGGAFTAPVPYVFWMGYRDGVYPIANENLNGAVNAIALQGSAIYVGGEFTSASGVAAASYVARQSGSNFHWTAVGSGFDGPVRALAIQGHSLVAGGDFLNSGAIGVTHVAKFNGSAWSPLGSGTDGSIYGLAADNNFIYVGGGFFNAGNKPANNFSLWGKYYLYLPILKK
jgi:hypothetical protein